MTDSAAANPDPAKALLLKLVDLAEGDRPEVIRQTDDPHATLDQLLGAATQLAQTDTGPALEATGVVVELTDQLGRPDQQAQARRSRARALAYAGQFEASLALSREAVGIARAADEHVETGRAQLTSMHALGELGRLDEASTVGHDARRLFVDIDRPDLAARADINLGIILQRHERPEQSLDHYESARHLLDADDPVSGHLDNSRGEALVALNRFSLAEESFTAALARFEAQQSWLTAAIAESNLADLSARQGRLGRALRWFERARRHLGTAKSPAVLARLLAEQADAKTVLGLPAEAQSEYEVAIDQLDGFGLAIEAARARAGLGMALRRLGRRSEAATALAAARMAFDELGIPVASARVDLARAAIELECGRSAAARRLAVTALATLNDRPADLAVARHLMASVAWSEGDQATATADLAAALQAARSLDLAPMLADLLDTRARHHLEAGDLPAAVADLEAAVVQIERLRGSLQADRFRAAFHGDREGTYQTLVAVHLLDGTPSSLGRAFEVTEQARSRSLLDQVARVDATSTERDEEGHDHRVDDQGDVLAREAAVLRSELNGLYSRLADESTLRSAPGRAAWCEEVRAREDALESLSSRLAASRANGWLYTDPLTLDAVQRHLTPGQTLLSYYAVDDELTAMVVGPDRLDVVRNLGPVPDVAERLGRLQFQFDRVLHGGGVTDQKAERCLADAQRELGALHDMVLAPLESMLTQTTCLTVIPWGPLHALPFAALWNGHEYLIDRTALHVVPSASLLTFLGSRGSAAGSHERRAVVLGVADQRAPQIAVEARAVARQLGVSERDLLLGPDATVAALQERARGASMLHLACHGRFLPGSPQASGLRLADRWMTADEIQELALDADLVVVSACETGLHQVDRGEEVLGLLRSFFVAGAHRVLVSLWAVDDESTRLTMDRFHSRWHTGDDSSTHAADALRSAQLDVREERPHPAHWAPFLLAGLS